MDNMERLKLVDKMLSDLEVIIDRKTTLLKSSTCIEPEKIDSQNGAAVKKLAEFQENTNKVLGKLQSTYNQLMAAKNRIVADRKLNEYLPQAG